MNSFKELASKIKVVVTFTVYTCFIVEICSGYFEDKVGSFGIAKDD